MLHLIDITPHNTNIFNASYYIEFTARSLSLQFATENTQAQIAHNISD